MMPSVFDPILLSDIGSLMIENEIPPGDIPVFFKKCTPLHSVFDPNALPTPNIDETFGNCRIQYSSSSYAGRSLALQRINSDASIIIVNPILGLASKCTWLQRRMYQELISRHAN